jgi:ferric-dicitrate binding protein FerR (iron transport regulator)
MSCERWEQTIADYLEGQIDEAAQEALLAHVEQCDHCRHEMQAYLRQEQELESYFARERERVERLSNPLADVAGPGGAARAGHASSMRPWAWAAAAVVLIVSGGLVYRTWRLSVPTGDATLATIQTADGDVLLLEDGQYRLAEAGDPVRQGIKFKVGAAGYAALTLAADGNTIEVNGGTQLTLADFPDRLEVQMDRGQVWAHLPHKPLKPFAVQTAQLTATAHGTVYGVEQELDRTIVLVADGTVEVVDGGSETLLAAGDSYNSLTDAAEPLATESVAWSRLRDSLLWLVDQTVAAADELPSGFAEPTPTPDPTPANVPAVSAAAPIEDLTSMLPPETVFFLDLRDWPSLIGGLRQSSYSIFLNQPNMGDWWQSVGGHEFVRQLIDELKLMDMLGIAGLIDGQVVAGVGVVPNADGTARHPSFLLLADCHENASALQAKIDELYPPEKQLASSRHSMTLQVRIAHGYLVATYDQDLLGETIDALASGQPTAFDSAGFRRKVLDIAGDAPGAIALDVAGIYDPIRPELSAESEAAFNFAGISSLDYALFAPRFRGQGIAQAARLGFKQHRAGVLGWLAKPGPMRGLDFFSPEVPVCGSIVVKNPRVAYYDLMDNFKDQPAMSPPAMMLHFLGEHQALLDSIGNEIAIGIENPILPVPNVKVAVEIRDPATFQTEFNGLVDRMLTMISLAGNVLVVVETNDYKGRTIYSIVVEGAPIELSWTYVDDFLVLGPGPRFVQHSIDVHDSGRSITRDSRLLDLLPSGTGSTFSVLVYQNVAAVLPDLFKTRLLNQLSPQEKAYFPDISFLSRYNAPGIAYAYAADDSIDFYLNTPDGIDLNMTMAIPVVANWLNEHTGLSAQLEKFGETESRLDSVAAAAMLFYQNKGQWPSSLSELLGDPYLQAVPEDPFGAVPGDALRMIAGPGDGQISFYSLGPDGVDNQATIAYDPVHGIEGEGDILIRLPLEENPGAEPAASTAAP